MIKTVPVVMDPVLAKAKFEEYDEFITAREKAEEEAKERASDIPAAVAGAGYVNAGKQQRGLVNVTGPRNAMALYTEQITPPPISARIDIALRDAYKAVAEGKAVIDLTATFKKAGEDNAHRPKLGIGRATWRGVKMSRNRNGSFSIGNIQDGVGDTFSFPEETLHFHREEGVFSATAVIPSIPPKLRPDNLNDFCVLWEPLWVGQAPPREKIDPLLLRPLGLGSPLYVVVAAWDLTPIEAAALSMA